MKEYQRELMDLKDYLDTELGVDISKRDRRKPYVAGKRVFCNIVKSVYPKIPYQRAASFIGVDHSTYIYHNSERAPDMTPFQKKIFQKTHKILKGIGISSKELNKKNKEITIKELKSRLRSERINLSIANNKIEELKSKKAEEFLSKNEKRLFKILLEMNEKGVEDLIQKALIIQKMNAA